MSEGFARCETELHQAYDTIRDLERQLAECQRLMREHQWDGFDESAEGYSCCYVCQMGDDEGHSPDCEWARAIGEELE